MARLKRCPFCAEPKFLGILTVPKETTTIFRADLEVQSVKFSSIEHYAVTCYNCGSRGPNELSHERATDMWNMRREVHPSEI